MAATSLLPDERQALILARLAADGRVIAADLARALGVSEDTVRRDLRDLAADGAVRRVYGGALPASPAGGSLRERQHRDAAPKAALARAAARLVRPGQILFLDVGSTNAAIAAALPAGFDLTVATNAPMIAAALTGRDDVDVILIGGRIDHHVGAALGAEAVRGASAIRADLCFLGTCAIEAEAGITAFDHEDAAFKRAIAATSGTVVAAATSEKVGTVAPFAVLPADELGDLVVMGDAPAAEIARLAARGVRVHRVADGG
jgi:DeoR/GlpR family transcriptional regulator of sugar metabolism